MIRLRGCGLVPVRLIMPPISGREDADRVPVGVEAIGESPGGDRFGLGQHPAARLVHAFQRIFEDVRAQLAQRLQQNKQIQQVVDALRAEAYVEILF